jgi:hypothetical protein
MGPARRFAPTWSGNPKPDGWFDPAEWANPSLLLSANVAHLLQGAKELRTMHGHCGRTQAHRGEGLLKRRESQRQANRLTPKDGRSPKRIDRASSSR